MQNQAIIMPFDEDLELKIPKGVHWRARSGGQLVQVRFLRDKPDKPVGFTHIFVLAPLAPF